MKPKKGLANLFKGNTLASLAVGGILLDVGFLVYAGGFVVDKFWLKVVGATVGGIASVMVLVSLLALCALAGVLHSKKASDTRPARAP